jgi:hypothetical protein
MAEMKWPGLQMARVFNNGRLLKKYSLPVSALPELWGWLSFRRGSWATSEEGVGRRLAVLWPRFGRARRLAGWLAKPAIYLASQAVRLANLANSCR